MEEVVLTVNDYSKLKKIIKNDNNDKKYFVKVDKKKYEYQDKEFWLIKVCDALNIKDTLQRYDYIYETMCDILDDISHRLCDFSCNKCFGNRCGNTKHEIDGCCYFHGAQCPYLVNKVCQKRSISCKIFMCEPLEKKYKFKSKVETYPLLNLFFNRKQQNIIHYSYREDKDFVLSKLIANKNG